MVYHFTSPSSNEGDTIVETADEVVYDAGYIVMMKRMKDIVQ